jgi:hypothetical protein
MLLPGFCNIQCNMSTVNNAYYTWVSSSIFSRVWDARSLVFCVLYCRSLFVLLLIVFGFSPLDCLTFYLWFLTFPHCIVCTSIDGFWLFPIVLFVLLFMVSDFSALYCLSFYLWFQTFPHCIVCSSIYGFCLFPIVLFVLLFIVSDFSPLTENTMRKSQKP